MSIKPFIPSLIIIYFLLSLPAVFGIGYVIDWAPEVTFLQKFSGYVIEGITNNYLIKLVISIFAGIIFSLFLSNRKAVG